MLNPVVVQRSIHQVNIDRNLNLSTGTVVILTKAINRTFHLADAPEKNMAEIDSKISALKKDREELKMNCDHVWLNRSATDFPYRCDTCGVEVPIR